MVQRSLTSVQKTISDEFMSRISIDDYVMTGKYLKLKIGVIEKQVNDITKAIGSTIQYLHTYGIILRDLDAKKISLSQM